MSLENSADRRPVASVVRRQRVNGAAIFVVSDHREFFLRGEATLLLTNRLDFFIVGSSRYGACGS
jgi:hypothetical protein